MLAAASHANRCIQVAALQEKQQLLPLQSCRWQSAYIMLWCRLTLHDDNDGPKVVMTTGSKQVDIYAAMAEAAETVVHTGSTEASQLVAHKCVPLCLQRRAALQAACWACACRWRFLELLLVLQPALFVRRPHRPLLWAYVHALGCASASAFCQSSA